MALTDIEYLFWLRDPLRVPFRILLIQADHFTGTYYIGSDAYVDFESPYEGYDDVLVSTPGPMLEASLDGGQGVGDFDVQQNDDGPALASLGFEGRECRWYLGDVAWPLSDFRLYGRGLTKSCRAKGRGGYTFDLIEPLQVLNRTFTTGDSTVFTKAKGAINSILATAGLTTARFVNVPNDRSWFVRVELAENSNLKTVLEAIAISIGAYVRVDADGRVAIFRPDNTETPIDITEDEIADESVNVVEELQAYNRVRVELQDGTAVTSPTSANTGELDEEFTVTTLLTNTTEAETLRSELVAYHSDSHPLWEIGMLDVVGALSPGDQVTIDHDDLTREGLSQGVVENIRRSPLSPFTYVEVRF